MFIQFKYVVDIHKSHVYFGKIKYTVWKRIVIFSWSEINLCFEVYIHNGNEKSIEQKFNSAAIYWTNRKTK